MKLTLPLLGVLLFCIFLVNVHGRPGAGADADPEANKICLDRAGGAGAKKSAAGGGGAKKGKAATAASSSFSVQTAGAGRAAGGGMQFLAKGLYTKDKY